MRTLSASDDRVPAVCCDAGSDSHTREFDLWDQTGPDLITVNAYTWKYYPDGAAVGIAFLSQSSARARPHRLPVRCLIQPSHLGSIRIRSIITASNVAGESPKDRHVHIHVRRRASRADQSPFLAISHESAEAVFISLSSRF